MCYRIRRSPVQLIDVTASAGGGGGSLPATAGNMVPDFGTVNGGDSFTVPAGAYKVTVWNEGLKNITVDGDTKTPGSQPYVLEYAVNKTNNTQDFTPAIQIDVPAGGQARYLAYRPS